MSLIAVLINGAEGKMGREVMSAVGRAEGMYLVGKSDKGDDLAQKITTCKPHVVVDFTRPDVAMEMAEIIVKSGAGGVIGTTGFTFDNIAELTTMCEEREPALLIAPNFSIGAVLMMKLCEFVAPYMPEAEIIEMHHEGKADTLSGTAIRTAELIADAGGGYGDEPIPPHQSRGERGKIVHGVHVHSVRLPGLVAHQQVIFGGEGQTLTIRHDSTSRSSFMPGVLMGIRAVMERQGLIHGLDKILLE